MFMIRKATHFYYLKNIGRIKESRNKGKTVNSAIGKAAFFKKLKMKLVHLMSKYQIFSQHDEVQ